MLPLDEEDVDCGGESLRPQSGISERLDSLYDYWPIEAQDRMREGIREELLPLARSEAMKRSPYPMVPKQWLAEALRRRQISFLAPPWRHYRMSRHSFEEGELE